MLKNTALFLLLFCFSISYAQVKKGSWLIDAQNTWDFYSVQENLIRDKVNSTNLSLNTTAGYFVTEGMVFGTGINYSRVTNIVENLNFGTDSEIIYRSLPIFYRQYINPGKVRLFAAIQADFTRSKLTFQGADVIDESFENYYASLGFNAFITDYIAFEGKVTNRMSHNDFSWAFTEKNGNWFLDFDIQLFLMKREKLAKQSGGILAAQYLKKGNTVVTGTIESKFLSDNDENLFLNINPGFRHFLMNRVELGGRLFYERELNNSGFFLIHTIGLDALFKYYISIKNNFFFSPGVKLGYSRSKRSPHITIQSSSSTRFERFHNYYRFGPIIEFLYFQSSQNLFKINLTAEFLKSKQHQIVESEKTDPFSRFNSLESNLRVSWQHFIYKNLAFECFIQYNLKESENRFYLQGIYVPEHETRIQPGFGFQYFISQKADEND